MEHTIRVVRAEKLYRRAGFAHYALDPAVGQAGFMQKWLA